MVAILSGICYKYTMFWKVAQSVIYSNQSFGRVGQKLPLSRATTEAYGGQVIERLSGLLLFSGRAISRIKSIGLVLITNGIVRLTERLCSDRQAFFLPPLKRVSKPRGISATENDLTIQNIHAAYFLPKTNGNQITNGSLFALLLSRAENYAVKCSYCFT